MQTLMMEIAIAAKGLNINPGAFRKSSYSGPHCDNCVEVAMVDDVVAVRHSRHPTGPVLTFTIAEWEAFLNGAVDGEFDPNLPGTTI